MTFTNTNIKNFKKIIKYLYIYILPRFLKVILSYIFDLDINRLRANVGIRAEDYYQACKKQVIIENGINNNRYLHIAFKKHLVRSKLIKKNWWSDFFLLVTLSDSSKFDKINKSLIKGIETSNFDSIEYFEILDIYSLCLRLSLFELAYHVRQKALEKALNYSCSTKKIQSWKLKAKLSALIEIEDFKEFDRLFPMINKKKEKYFLNFLRIVFGNRKSLSDENFINKIDSFQDQEFRKYVENKNIAIVGPAPVEKKDGFEIDNSEIVLRTNYKLGDPAIKGLKCNINYFNLETAQHIDKNGCLEWPSNTNWIIGKAKNYMEMILARLSSDGVKVDNLNLRTLKIVDSALFNGSLSLIQNIIFDLSRFNPKKIYLYHFDVMLSKDRISGYYTDIKNNYDLHLKMTKCFPGHDPVTQFLILKSFWKLGFIEGDDRFEEVMKMKAKDYMLNMQKNYLDINKKINNGY